MTKKILLISTILGIVFFIMGVGMFSTEFNVQGSNARMHKKDLHQHGVLLLNSSDEDFSREAAAWLNDKQGEFQLVGRTLGPFSVFVKNTTEKDIIAYKLNWEIKASDGRVSNYPRTYFAPAYLTGVSRSKQLDDAMRSVKRGNARFFTMIPTPFEEGDNSRSSGSGSGVFIARAGTESQVGAGAAVSANLQSVVDTLSKKLGEATDITVSIESVLFDDGAFVGPAGDIEFIRLKASISAKYDLLSEMKQAFAVEKLSAGKVLDRVAAIAKENATIPTAAPDFTSYYRYFRSLQAQEVLSARSALKDDEKAVSIFLNYLEGDWIIPFEKSNN
jgi:hypothetical protein